MKRKAPKNTYHHMFTEETAQTAEPLPRTRRARRSATIALTATQAFVRELALERQARNSYACYDKVVVGPHFEAFKAQLKAHPDELGRLRMSPDGTMVFVPMDHPAYLFLQMIIPADSNIEADGEFYMITRSRDSLLLETEPSRYETDVNFVGVIR